jgi:hypothetical protein
MPIRLGELLLKENMVSPQQLLDALNHAKMSGGKLSSAIVKLGFVKDEEITKALSRQLGVPWITLDHLDVDPAIIEIVPAGTARKFQVLPLSRSDRTLTIAMADPTNVFVIDELRSTTGCHVEPVVASESALEVAIDRHYGSARLQGLRLVCVDDTAAIGSLPRLEVDSMGEADANMETVKTDDYEVDLRDLSKSADAAPVIKLTYALLADSLIRGASDIHIEPCEKDVLVRFRIDGLLYDVMALPMDLRAPLTQRIKSMANLNVAQTQLPHDGCFKVTFKVEDHCRGADFRVSLRPTQWGETIVLRLLHTSAWQERGQQLSGERDEAPARAAELESQLERPKSLSTDEEFIAEHLAEGRVFRTYGFVDRARAQFETVLERFPDNSEALGELHHLQQDEGEIAARVLRGLVETIRLEGDTDEGVNTRVSFAELLVNENIVSLECCMRALMDQKVNGGDLRTAVVRLGFAKDEEIAILLSRISSGSR